MVSTVYVFPVTLAVGLNALNSAERQIKTDVDIEDSTYDVNNCHAVAACTTVVGDYNSTCNDDYTGNGIQCSDFDECYGANDNYSDLNAECDNIIGSF